MKVILDKKKWSGCGICEQFCPKSCYEMDRNQHIAIMPRPNQFVQYGACIVLCPFDALYFKGPKGEMLSPENIR